MGLIILAKTKAILNSNFKNNTVIRKYNMKGSVLNKKSCSFGL